MIFQELLKQTDINEIINYFNSNEYESSFEEDYRKLYDKLIKQSNILDSGLRLFAVSLKDYFEDIESIQVFGYSEEKNEHYALDFMEIAKWLGSECIQKSIDKYGQICFVAECLKEMTFISFDENDVQKEREILEERLEEVSSGNVTYISAEEMLRELREKYDFLDMEVDEDEFKYDEEHMKEIINLNKNRILEMVS